MIYMFCVVQRVCGLLLGFGFYGAVGIHNSFSFFTQTDEYTIAPSGGQYRELASTKTDGSENMLILW